MLKRFYGSICGSSKCMVRISVDKCLLETSLSISRVWPHVLSLKSTVHNTEATRARPVTKYGASGWKQKAIEFCASGIMTSCAIAGALWRQFTQHCMATRSRTRLNTIAENVRRSDRSPHPGAQTAPTHPHQGRVTGHQLAALISRSAAARASLVISAPASMRAISSRRRSSATSMTRVATRWPFSSASFEMT